MGKKLIEVALPLEAINVASAREKSIRHGHPSTLHLWWARRPLAAARAVIFSQMVDDPAEHVAELLIDPLKKQRAMRELGTRHEAWNERLANQEAATRQGDLAAPAPGPEPTLEACVADIERERLFEIIRQLVRWENTTNETVLQAARDEIWRSWRYTCAENAEHPRAEELFDPQKLPAFHDPFAGGGALPLEAQRLGLEAHASDLNPVAVLINKAMIEIPPKFAGRPPVNPASRQEQTLLTRQWRGAQGLADDVRYYGQWMRDEAQKRIGHLYPKVEITAEMAQERPDLQKYVGQQLTVIAWLWARTVKSPNPAFAQVDVPLASTFMLSTKAGKEAHVEPVIEEGGYRFTVNVGQPKDAVAAKNGTKLAGANFVCLVSGAPISGSYIMAEGKAGRIGARLMAIVADSSRGRVYLSPSEAMEAVARQAKPAWQPDVEFLQQALGFRIGNYGMTKWSDLFTPRQLVALTTFSDLVQEAREQVKGDALAAGITNVGELLLANGLGATAYSDALGMYLAFALDRCADFSNSCTRWVSGNQKVMNLFGKQTISMTWDFPEAAILQKTVGGFTTATKYIAECIQKLPPNGLGTGSQRDAAKSGLASGKVVSTDPPYYDNIGYADLSDFFYVWLRHSLKPVFSDLFDTVVVPKAEELVATPYRHGGKK